MSWLQQVTELFSSFNPDLKGRDSLVREWIIVITPISPGEDDYIPTFPYTLSVEYVNYWTAVEEVKKQKKHFDHLFKYRGGSKGNFIIEAVHKDDLPPDFRKVFEG